MIIGYVWTADMPLRPCPFCGMKSTHCEIKSTNIVTVAKKPVYDAVIYCHGCGCTMHYLEADKDLAVATAKALWNKRAGDEE